MASSPPIPQQTNTGNKAAPLQQILNPTECLITHSAERDNTSFDEASSDDARSSDRPASPIWDTQSQLDRFSTTMALSESQNQSRSIDDPNQATGTNTAVDINVNREHHGIYWEQAGYMFVLAFSGAVLAIGHHVYYSKLDGTPVASDGHQQWAIRFGTALSFLANSSYKHRPG